MKHNTFNDVNTIVKYCICIITLIFVVYGSKAFAQSDTINTVLQSITVSPSDYRWMTFKVDSAINPLTIFTKYKAAFDLSSHDSMQLVKIDSTDGLNFLHYRYQQFYKGVMVENGEFVIHSSASENGNIASYGNGLILRGLNIDTASLITPAAAFDSMLAFINADAYVWDDDSTIVVVPTLIIDSRTPMSDICSDSCFIMYKASIATVDTPTSCTVYIDASSGKLHRVINDFIFCTSGTAQTLFNGTKTVKTKYTVDYYSIDDCDRNIVTGVWDYTTCDKIGNIPQCRRVKDATSARDGDNIWGINAAEAMSAHWATEMSYDYYNEEFNYKSYDGKNSKIEVFCDVDAFYYIENNHGNKSLGVLYGAGWFPNHWPNITHKGLYLGQAGNIASYPFVSLDVVGHELSHGVQQGILGEKGFDRNSREPLTLAESYADIFGTMIEFYAQEKYQPSNVGDYFILEDMIVPGHERSMSSPNSQPYGDPDTYGYNGANKNWNYKAHSDNGPHNYWFYLLAEGGSGTNAAGYSYNVAGIGKDKASAIAFRCLSKYLTRGSNYRDSRRGTISAARDLYGVCSYELGQTLLAWEAIGVNGRSSESDGWRYNWVTHDDYAINGPYQLKAILAVVAMDEGGFSPSVKSAITTTFIAGDRVQVQNEFHAESGSIFHARIDQCHFQNARKNAPVNSDNVLPKSSRMTNYDNSLKIVPNPAKEQVVISFQNENNQLVSVQVFDRLGRIVGSVFNGELQPGEFNFSFDTRELSSGVYYVRLQKNGFVESQKVVVLD